jgi:ubiquinone biosynthesis protein
VKTQERNSLERGLFTLLDSYYALPIKNMDIGGLLRSLLALLREHRLRLPIDMVVMIKSLVTAEGSARLVYPELNVVEELKESVNRLALERYKPRIIWRSLRNSFFQYIIFEK